MYTFAGHKDSIKSVAVSSDGRFIVSGSSDKTVKVWNIQERKEEFTLTSHTSIIGSVAISANCKFFMSASNDQTIKVWKFNN